MNTTARVWAPKTPDIHPTGQRRNEGCEHSGICVHDKPSPAKVCANLRPLFKSVLELPRAPMATIDQLKKNDGNAVKLGAVRPNSFGDVTAASSNPQLQGTPSAAAPRLGATPAPTARGLVPASLGHSKLGAVRHHPVGKITGKGTGTSDQVPINASNGEFILKAAAVKIIGLETLEVLNAIADRPDEKDSKTEKMAEYGDAESKKEDQGEGPESAEGMKCGGKVKGMATGGLIEDPKKNSFGDAAAASSNPQVQVTPSKALNQPATPGLDAPPANPVSGFSPASIDQTKLGAVASNPAAASIAPASTKNSFGDAAASSLDARVSQIPATGGTFPAPAPDGKDNTEVSRNVGNALSALPGASPALGAIRSLAGASKVGTLLDAVGGGAGAIASKVAPYAVPAAGLGVVAAASQPDSITSTPAATPALPGTPAAVSQSTSSPAGATTTVAPPTGALPSPGQVTKTVQPNGVTSYSGAPNIAGDINLPGPRGGTISAQNNQAAENLARAGGQTTGFGPAGAIRGGGQVSSMETSAGYSSDLKQLAGIETGKAAQETNMQAQADYAANKVLEGRALAGNRGALQIMGNNARSKTEQRGQDIQAGATRANYQLAQENQKLVAAKDGREATSAGFQNRAAGRIEALQAAYESAKPEDKAGIAEQLHVLTGKGKPQDEYIMANGGQMIDPGGEQFNPNTGKMEPRPSTGQVINSPQVPINKRTGLSTQQVQGGSQSKVPHAQDIARLKANPKEAAMFEQIYGAGAAKQYLGK